MERLLQCCKDYWSDLYSSVRGFQIQIQATPHSCDLKWHLSSSAFFEYSYFLVEILRLDKNRSWDKQYESSTTESSFLARNLQMGQSYRFRVTPIQDNGMKRLSYRSRTITLLCLPPPVVRRLTNNASDICFHLTWDLPEEILRIKGYFVEQICVDSKFGWIRLNNEILQDRSYVVSNPEPGKWYNYRIVVVTDGVEYLGDESHRVKAMKPPMRPTDPVVYDITSTSCSLEWKAPEFDGGSPIRSYEIDIKQCGGQWTRKYTTTTDVLSAKIKGLLPNNLYSFRVRAVTVAGQGGWSEESLSCNVTDFKIQIQATPHSCDLKWHLSSSEFSEFSYLVEILRLDRNRSWDKQYESSTTETSFLARNLQIGQSYRFRVTLIQDNGKKRHSYRSRTITLLRAPPPVVRRITDNASDICFHLTWDLPDEILRIKGYFVEQICNDSEFGWIRLNNEMLEDRSYVVSNPEPGKWYNYRIVVVTAGVEYFGNESHRVKAMKPPMRPTDPVVYDITSTSCTLEWKAPEFDGGSPIICYEIDIKQCGGQWTRKCTTSADDLSAKITDLILNKLYSFRVRALTDAGQGGWSEESLSCNVTGIDFKDSSRLQGEELAVIEKEGKQIITASFELGISYFFKLLDSLQRLKPDITVNEGTEIGSDILFYSKRLAFHFQRTSENLDLLNKEITRRIENVLEQIAQKERERNKDETELKKLDKELSSIRNQLEELQKEKQELDEKFQMLKEDLEAACSKLTEAKNAQAGFVIAGTVGLFVPIFGWAVSAVTLPMAFTVLQAEVDTAKYKVEMENRSLRDNETRIKYKRSEINENAHNSQNLREKQKIKEENIKALTDVRVQLQQKINQQADISFRMRQCAEYVGGAHSRAEVLEDQIKFFYDLSTVIEPLMDLANHLSKDIASKFDLVRFNVQIETSANRLRMIAAANSLNIPEYQKDFRVVSTTSYHGDEAKTTNAIHSLEQQIMSSSNEDEKMILTEYANCSEFLGSAPATIALLGQLLSISLQHDFELDKKHPVGGFKYLKQPKSFRVSLFQTATAASDAFSMAHRNMDKIQLYAKSVPMHLAGALKLLQNGSAQEISRLLGKPLSSIKNSSHKCLRLAKTVQDKFMNVILLLDELQEACVSKKSQTDKEKEEYEASLIEAKQEQETMESKLSQLENDVKMTYVTLQHEEKMLKKEKAKTITTGLKGLVSRGMTAIFGGDTSINSMQNTEQKSLDEMTPDPLVQNIDIDHAEIALEDAMNLEKISKSLHTKAAEKDDKNKTQFIRMCKNQYCRIEDRHKGNMTYHSFMSQIVHLSRQGKTLCDDLVSTISQVVDDRQQNNETEEHLRRLCKECEEFVSQATRVKSFVERQLNTSLCTDLDETETGNYEIDQIKYKVGKTFKRMKKAAADNERASKRAKRVRIELSNVIAEIAGLEIETLDLETVMNLLARSLKELGKLKEEWGKLVKLFQSISNIIDSSLNDGLKCFVDVAENIGKSNSKTLKLSATKRQLLYDQVFQASGVAYFVQNFTETYTEVSEKYFLPVSDALPLLLKCTEESNPAEIEEKLKKLKSDCVAAQYKINQHLDLAQTKYSSTVRARLTKLEDILKDTIPTLTNSGTRLEDTLKDKIQVKENKNAKIIEIDDFL